MNKLQNKNFKCLIGHSVLYSKLVYSFPDFKLEEEKTEYPYEFSDWIYRMLKGYLY